MKVLSGKVISAKMKNTVVVEVKFFNRDKIYGKIVKKFKKIKADTNNLEIKEGDTVTLQNSRPLSKEKHFLIKEILK